MMKHALAPLASTLILLAMTSGAPAEAAVASPSPGCTQMNSGSYDAVYTSGPTLYQDFGWTFAAGEQFIVTAGTPSAGTSVATALTVAGSVTRSITAGVPGVMTYTLTEDLDSAGEGVTWGITSGVGGVVNATWTVECIAFTPPPPTASDAGPADQVQQVAAMPGGTCLDVDMSRLEWGQGIVGGWSQSWAQWPHGGIGGRVCTRTVRYSSGAWLAVER